MNRERTTLIDALDRVEDFITHTPGHSRSDDRGDPVSELLRSDRLPHHRLATVVAGCTVYCACMPPFR